MGHNLQIKMIAITLGYQDKRGKGPFEVLYAGGDANEADRVSLNPPKGIARTELIKHPVITRRRIFEEGAAEVAVPEAEQEVAVPEVVPEVPVQANEPADELTLNAADSSKKNKK